MNEFLLTFLTTIMIIEIHSFGDSIENKLFQALLVIVAFMPLILACLTYEKKQRLLRKEINELKEKINKKEKKEEEEK